MTQQRDALTQTEPSSRRSSLIERAIKALILFGLLAGLAGSALLLTGSLSRMPKRHALSDRSPPPRLMIPIAKAADSGFDTSLGLDGLPIVAPASEASALLPSASDGVVTQPSWRVRPSSVYPAAAAMAGIDQGSATLRCRITPSGRVEACRTLTETPHGHGFAAAALDGARLAKLSPRTVDGTPTGGVVQFTMRFRMEDGPPQASVIVR